ncbi:MAG: 50S ribosomal protein L29 [Syntrophobacteraceae bacterium]|jgi:large subunit ribosomal protein L29
MKSNELRDLTKDELTLKVKEMREALFNLQFQHATGQLENTAQLKKTRKDIARAMTVLSAMERASAA